MNKSQNSKVQAWILLRILCNANNLIWSTLAAFVSSFGVFSDRLNTLIENARLQEELITGFARQKQQSKFKLAKIANAVRSKVQAYANTTDDQVLYNKVNYSFSKLIRMNGPALVLASKNIIANAQENQAALEPYGLVPDEILALDDALIIFTNAMVMPRQAIAQVKGLTQRIKEDVSFIEKLISKSLSKLMLNFQDSAPVFYADYFTCKRPIPYPTSHTEFQVFVQSANGNALDGVFITAVGTTKTYAFRTDATGKQKKRISPEIYDLYFEVPGYQPAQVNDLKVSPGEHEKVTITLQPLV